MSNNHLFMMVTFHVKNNKIAEAKQKFIALVAPSMKESGCIAYDLFQDNEDECKFVFFEEWANKESLEAHRQSPHILDIRSDFDVLLASPMKVDWFKKIT